MLEADKTAGTGALSDVIKTRSLSLTILSCPPGVLPPVSIFTYPLVRGLASLSEPWSPRSSCLCDSSCHRSQNKSAFAVLHLHRCRSKRHLDTHFSHTPVPISSLSPVRFTPRCPSITTHIRTAWLGPSLSFPCIHPVSSLTLLQPVVLTRGPQIMARGPIQLLPDCVQPTS